MSTKLTQNSTSATKNVVNNRAQKFVESDNP